MKLARKRFHSLSSEKQIRGKTRAFVCISLFGVIVCMALIIAPERRAVSGRPTAITASTGKTAQVRGEGVKLKPRLGVLSADSENENGESDPKPQLRVAPKLNLPGLRGGVRAVAPRDIPKQQELMNNVAQALAKDDIDVALVGGSKYMVSDCVGIKASVGEFTLRLGNPICRMEGAGFFMQFTVERISMYALKVRMRPCFRDGQCHFSPRFEVGGSAGNVRIEIRYDPRVDLDECQLMSLGEVDVKVRIGGLNLKPLQNNLDEVAKNMIEDSLTAALDSIIPGKLVAAVNGALAAGICEAKYSLYRHYMELMANGVVLHSLPQKYINALGSYYPHVDLTTVKFGHSDHQPPNNSTTDCNRIFFGDRSRVSRLENGTLPIVDEVLLHELRHCEQCVEFGGRQPYAERWFRDFEISVLTSNLNTNAAAYMKVLHDRMPMEKDAFSGSCNVYKRLTKAASCPWL